MRNPARFFVLVLLVVVACSEDKGILEGGEPRIPDDQGVVENATFQQIELDSGKKYDIRDDVESFNSRGHNIRSLLTWEKKYVHLGLDEDNQVTWIAGIGPVVDDGKSPYALYSGVLESRDEDRIFFEDGTVLRLAEGVKTPAVGDDVAYEIDVKRDLVRKVLQ